MFMNYKASPMNQPNQPDKDASRATKVRQKRIGDQLRRLYDDVTKEPVPDEFLQLLEQADHSSKKK
ncbi:MAG: NepR family anti-sigma factor [Henriciella sp.]